MATASVLVVDDDVGMVDTLGDILSASGYEVTRAHSAQAAVAMVGRTSYDVVLMDIQMPGVNGVEALKAMKTVAPRTCVIMMTAFTRHDLVEEARRESALAVLLKPLDLMETLSLISGAVSGRTDT